MARQLIHVQSIMLLVAVALRARAIGRSSSLQSLSYKWDIY